MTKRRVNSVAAAALSWAVISDLRIFETEPVGTSNRSSSGYVLWKVPSSLSSSFSSNSCCLWQLQMERGLSLALTMVCFIH